MNYDEQEIVENLKAGFQFQSIPSDRYILMRQAQPDGGYIRRKVTRRALKSLQQRGVLVRKSRVKANGQTAKWWALKEAA